VAVLRIIAKKSQYATAVKESVSMVPLVWTYKVPLRHHAHQGLQGIVNALMARF
jgi:hypothetical protein